MALIKIPYDKGTVDLNVAEKNLAAVITADLQCSEPEKCGAAYVEEALAKPVGTKSLRELAIGKQKVVLVTSDHTRAVPSKITLPVLLPGGEEYKSKGGYYHSHCHGPAPGAY